VASSTIDVHLHTAKGAIEVNCVSIVKCAARRPGDGQRIARRIIIRPEFNIAGISRATETSNVGNDIHIVDNLLDDGWSYSIATFKRQAGDANFLRIVGEGVH